jgi:hypothetical protein
MSWYDFACKFADMKWKSASTKYQQDPDDLELRTAMRRWAFNTKQRDEAPDSVAVALRWLVTNTKPVAVLTV